VQGEERGLSLDHESHTYWFDGVVVAGVSEILCQHAGVDRSYFDDWSRDRGTAVHKAIEFWIDGRLNWSTVDERIKGYVDAALLFINDSGAQLGPGTYVERPVWHPVMRYAGTPDFISTIFGQDTLVDWKSGGIGAAGIATALYEMAARIAFPVQKPRRRMAVQLHENGTYKKADLSDGFDFNYAASAASLYNKFYLPKKQLAMRARRIA